MSRAIEDYEAFLFIPGDMAEPTIKSILADPRVIHFAVPEGCVDILPADPTLAECLRGETVPLFIVFEKSMDCYEFRRRSGRLHDGGRA
jgi:hypothetical protein